MAENNNSIHNSDTSDDDQENTQKYFRVIKGDILTRVRLTVELHEHDYFKEIPLNEIQGVNKLIKPLKFVDHDYYVKINDRRAKDKKLAWV